jgi:L-ribulose-5-phosphate 3-epimerase
MLKDEYLSRLGVCSWSLRPTGASNLVFQLQGLGLNKFQCALDPLRTDPKAWDPLPKLCADQGLTMVSGMFTTVGEDYSTLESIKRTGGVTPDATWDENWRNIREVARVAQAYRLRLVSFHAGFLPHEDRDPNFKKLLGRIAQIADLFADYGMDVAMETGQETAPTLRLFLEALNKRNIGVNFDPANMILYDQGDPIAALKELGPWIKSCHVKDALRTKVPGTWGAEVVVGTGQVDWRAFFQALKDIKFAGTLCIEREAGEQRAEDIMTGRRYITQIMEEVL